MRVAVVGARGAVTGARLIDSVIVAVDGARHVGLPSRPGFHLVAGLTGSGKSLLAEALWLGVNAALSLLETDDRCRDALKRAMSMVAQQAGIRISSIDRFEVCLGEGELADVKGPTCLVLHGVRVGRAENAYVEAGERRLSLDEAGEEVRRGLELAVRQVITVSSIVKDRVGSSEFLGELLGLLRMPDSKCLATAPSIVPAIAVFDHVSENVLAPGFLAGVEARVVAEYDHEEGRHVVRLSTGELNRELLTTYAELARALNEEARRGNVFVTPIVYFDDGFDGMDWATIRSLGERLREWGRDVAIYIPTHRVEAAINADRLFVVTYGLKVSELLELPSMFKVGLVDIEMVEREELIREINEKLIGEAKETHER